MMPASNFEDAVFEAVYHNIRGILAHLRPISALLPA